MENIVQIQYIISAFIGFVSAVIVAIIAGIFQLRIAKKNREIQEKQLEESRNQFFMQMEQSQKEYAEKIEQLREEQRKANLEKANDKLQAETNRFYEELIKEMMFYDSLLNELHYLNNIANPKDKEFRIKRAYSIIKFNDLSDIAKEKIAEREIERLKEDYDIEDRELFDKIKKGAVSQSNAREIKRLIKDTFSLVALKKICGETEI